MIKATVIELLVSTNKLKPEDIPKFEIGVKISNNQSHSIPVDLSECELYVNSERNLAWDLTVNNGSLINIKISPGKNETIFWPIGEALFESPGIYELKLVRKTDIQKQVVYIAEV